MFHTVKDPQRCAILERLAEPYGGLPVLGLPLHRSLIVYNGYTAGLGNRVRVVLGGRSLADHERRDFFYVWPTGPKFEPSMRELWEVDGRQVSRATSRLLARRWHYVDESLDWLDAAKRREHIWQIRTGSELRLPSDAQPWTQLLRALVPVPEIAQLVHAHHERHLAGRTYVAVMIRAHGLSHAKTRDSSPVGWFVERMRQLRADDPSLAFFLSCDTPEVQEQVMGQIPDCSALSDKGGYNTRQGVRSALADLYLLASGARLLGPHFSSFVELAQHLSDDVLRLETPRSPVDATDAPPAAVPVAPDPLRPWQR